jgi:putative Mn2+ efflux pump MntP
MNVKTKECFKPHVLMHSLVGLGIGLLLASLISGLRHWWIGVIIIAVGTVLDIARKS